MNRTIYTDLYNKSLNPLHRATCNGPHIDDEGHNYTYVLTDGSTGGITFLAVVNIIATIPTVAINGAILAAFVTQKKARTISNRLFFTICAADLLV